MKPKRYLKSPNAFTLVEVLITAGIIGVLAAIVFPNYVRARESAETAIFVANVRSASGAFFTYFGACGAFPDASAPGVIPNGMESYLENFPWTKPTGLGGQWSWDRDVNGYKAGLVLLGSMVAVEQMQVIDQKLDDGDLATGQFRAQPGGYVYVLDE